MSKSIYKSPEGYAALMTFYADHLSRWPTPYESLTVPTRHGETHLIASGHLIDLPLINNMAGSKDDVEVLGRALLQYPIEKLYTGHCTGAKAYRILRGVVETKLEYFATGDQAEI